jgi:glutamate--cysteine ligase catalytic subunit
MGLLYLGTPLTWDEASKHADHVREHGITQFLHTWDRVKDRHGDELLWGDEVSCHWSRPLAPILTYLLQIEYMVIAYDEKNKNAKLSLRQTEILAKLGKLVAELQDDIPDS